MDWVNLLVQRQGQIQPRETSKNRVNETGNTYGKWTVLNMEESTPRGEARCLVQCECGCTSVVRCNLLRQGKSSQCRSCSAYERNARDKENGINYLPFNTKSARLRRWERTMRAMEENYTYEGAY